MTMPDILAKAVMCAPNDTLNFALTEFHCELYCVTRSLFVHFIVCPGVCFYNDCVSRSLIELLFVENNYIVY